MVWTRLSVTRGKSLVVVRTQARRRPRSVAAPHPRRWTRVTSSDSSGAPAQGRGVVLLPLIVVVLVAAIVGSFEVALIAGTAALVATAVGGRSRTRKHPPGALVITEPAAQHTMLHALRSADRISATWPTLGDLLTLTDAEALLTEALWELAGTLVRAQELRAVLAEMSRPEFAPTSESDTTARELGAARRATGSALAALDDEIARRVATVERAEAAGRTYIRETEMREAIRAARESLSTVRPGQTDPATELAERTRSVLDAYRELTP